MADEYWNHVTRKPRHKASEASGLRVEVRRSIEVRRDVVADSAPLRAELLDLSRSGVLLRLAAALHIDEPIGIRLEDESSNIDLTLSAVVRWCQREEDGRWSVGCESDHPLPWETLGELFLGEILVVDAPPFEVPKADDPVADASSSGTA